MKGEVKLYRKGIDERHQCGRLSVRAENEFDAKLLAEIANGLFYDQKVRVRLLDAMFPVADDAR